VGLLRLEDYTSSGGAVAIGSHGVGKVKRDPTHEGGKGGLW